MTARRQGRRCGIAMALALIGVGVGGCGGSGSPSPPLARIRGPGSSGGSAASLAATAEVIAAAPGSAGVSELAWGDSSNPGSIAARFADGRFAVYGPRGPSGRSRVDSPPGSPPCRSLRFAGRDRLAVGSREGLALWDVGRDPPRVVGSWRLGRVSALGVRRTAGGEGPQELLAGCEDGRVLRVLLARGDRAETAGEVTVPGPVARVEPRSSGEGFAVVSASGAAWSLRDDLAGGPRPIGAARGLAFARTSKLRARLTDGPRVTITSGEWPGPTLGRFSPPSAATSVAISGDGGHARPRRRGADVVGAHRPGRGDLPGPRPRGAPGGGARGAGLVARLAGARPGGRIGTHRPDRRRIARPKGIAHRRWTTCPSGCSARDRGSTGRGPRRRAQARARARARARRIGSRRCGRRSIGAYLPRPGEMCRRLEARDDLGRDERAEIQMILAAVDSLSGGGSPAEVARRLTAASALFAREGNPLREADAEFWKGMTLARPVGGEETGPGTRSSPEALLPLARSADLYRRADPPEPRRLAVSEAALAWVTLDLGDVAGAWRRFGPAGESAKVDPVLGRVAEIDRIASAIASAQGDWSRASASSSRVLARIEPGERPGLRRSAILDRSGALARLGAWKAAAEALAPAPPDDAAVAGPPGGVPGLGGARAPRPRRRPVATTGWPPT